MAWTYLGLGDIDAGPEWLETALIEREPYLGPIAEVSGYHAIRE